jgi:lipopolysaccharide/colanic/teichoic acid biosynthesis glycosyltransferase
MLLEGSAWTTTAGVIDRHGRVWRMAEAVAAAGGIVVLSPLLLVIALAVFAEDRGRVLFAQRRIYRHGRPFTILKFRSMLAAAEPAARTEPLQQPLDDARMTRVGRVLRRSHLDELPQLINVVLGQMSLVGPRPLVPDDDALVTSRWSERHLHRPGLTGAWQVHRSPERSVDELVTLDQAYLAHWSPWLDLRLIATTLVCVLRRSGR